MKKVFLLLSAIAGVINAHSWVTCTDYNMDNTKNSDMDTYDASKCRGFPRHFKNYDRGFGVDAGFNYQIAADGDNAAPCITKFGDGTPYTTDYPMAQYSAGQQVCLTWPTKNHVAASCNNVYIPDGGVKIFRSGVNPTSETTKSQLEGKLVKDLGSIVTPQNNNDFYTRPGFQRCPKFCENNDKAMCSQCFTLPSDLAEGTYSFAWFWIFNTGQLYTTCWEAKVGTGGGGGTGTDAPTSSTDPTTKPPLGQDGLAFEKVPSVFTTAPFDVKVRVNSASTRYVVIDILSTPDYKYYGKGYVTSPDGEDVVTITVTPENDPPNYQSYILKAWLVEKTVYDADPATAYLQELSRVESPATVGDKVVYSESSSSSSTNGGVIAGSFFGGFILCALIAGAIFLFMKYGARKV